AGGIRCARTVEAAGSEPGAAAKLDRDARVTQLPGVRLSSVARRVVFGGDHERRRKSVQVRSPQRRDRRCCGVVLAALGVAVEEPLHLLTLEEAALGVGEVRAG